MGRRSGRRNGLGHRHNRPQAQPVGAGKRLFSNIAIAYRPLTMKTPIRNLFLAASLTVLAACAQQSATMNPSPDPEATQALQAFPTAEPGYQRHVILLPRLDDEDLHKVELVGGKTLPVDCNVHGMDGQFNQNDVPGWGYTYWVLESRQQVRSTMMMCPDATKHDAFVQTESVLIRYNSRLPVVVFVPEGLSLRWRVWEGGPLRDAPSE